MIKLLKIEYLKIKSYTVVRAFLLLFAILLPFLFFALSRLEVPFFPSSKQMFAFPGVWNYLPYLASWFNIFPAVLIIVLVCNEVSFRTEKQNVIDGLSRSQVILSKFYLVLVFTLIIALYILLVGVIFGLIHGKASFLFWGFSNFLNYVLQTAAYFIFAMLMGVLLRKSALAVLAFMVIFFLAGLLLEGMLEELAQFSPMNAFNALVPNPYLSGVPGANQLTGITNAFELTDGMRYALVVVYLIVFVWLSNLVMKKRDL